MIPVGTKVQLNRDIDRYPHFVAEKGRTGEVVLVDPESRLIEVRMDEPLPGAEEWENCVQWYEDEFHEFHGDVEAFERPWANNSERLKITMGIPGDGQEGGFANATLQNTGNTFGKGELGRDLEFSVAVHVEIPGHIKTEDELANFLGGLFGELLDRPEGQGLHVEIQLGPSGDGWDDD